MKYAAVLNDMEDGTFRRKDVLDALLRKHPDYNVNSFNRHFSRLLSKDLIANVGRDLYITASPGTAKESYTYKNPSDRFSDVLNFLDSEFPSADFIVCETVQLNEFFDHQIAQNIVIVAAEKQLTDAIFERMKKKFRSVLLLPKPDDIRRYAEDGTVIIERLSSRYPKDKTKKHEPSIEKLVVDIIAEKRLRSSVNMGDYPSALRNVFRKYRINETAMLNYARMRRADTKIRDMLNKADVKLHTDGKNDIEAGHSKV